MFHRALSVLLFSTLFFLAQNASAQNDSFVEIKIVPQYIYLEQLNRDPDLLQKVDTGLNGLQYYDRGYLQNLGRAGTPVFPLTLQEKYREGFDLGFDQWNAYRYTPSSLRFFNTKNPYSDFTYLQGQGNFLKFGIIHSQNITPYWNFSVQYDRLALGNNSNLFSSSLNNIGVNTWYRSPGRKYMAVAAFIINRFKADETGGIFDYENYISTPAGFKNETAVKLADANQLWKDKDFMLQQFIYFGRSEQRKIHDTDSVAVKILYPRLYLSHRIDYYENQYIYKDTLPGALVYPAILNDSLLTKGQYWYNKWSNEVSVGRVAKVVPWLDSLPIFARAYGKLEMISIRENAYTSALNNFIIGAEATQYGKIRTDLGGSFTAAGWNAGDFYAMGKVSLPFVSGIHLPLVSLKGVLSRYEPNYMAQYFTGNHFYWNNDLKKTDEKYLKLEFSDTARVFSVGLLGANISNLVYYDTQAVARQYAPGINYAGFFLKKHFTLGSFHLNEDLTLQKVLNSDLIRLPDILSRTSFYFEHHYFKNALLGRIGFDLSYNTAYYAYDYMPETSKFFLQDKLQTGNYPVADLWLSAKVKTFRFVVKYEHVNQGFTGNNYFLLPYYPISPRALRIGLRWTFYN